MSDTGATSETGKELICPLCWRDKKRVPLVALQGRWWHGSGERGRRCAVTVFAVLPAQPEMETEKVTK